MLEREGWPVDITTVGSLVGGTLLWRTRGQLYATVVLKATFDLVAEGDMRLRAPDDLVRAEVHHGGSPLRSVQITSDFAPFIAKTDVVFTGSAHAPRGAPVASMRVRFALFRGQTALLDKALDVVGERKGEAAPLPFSDLPLVYERAFGGIGSQTNPVGVGQLDDERMPNVIDPRRPADLAGFAPISRAWHARRSRLGRTARRQLEARIADVPDTFDWSYFQASPEDQRTDFLHGGEWVVLEGLTRENAELRTRLPDAFAEAHVFGLTPGAPDHARPVQLRADTLRVDGDAMTCSVVWRGMLPIQGSDVPEGMRIVAGLATHGAGVDWTQAPERAATLDEQHDMSDLVRSLSTVELDPAVHAPTRIAIEERTTEALVDQPAAPFDEGTVALEDDGPIALHPAGRFEVVDERTVGLPEAEPPFAAIVDEGTVGLDDGLVVESTIDPTDRAATLAHLPFATRGASAPPTAAPPIPGAPWSPTRAPRSPARFDATRTLDDDPAPVRPSARAATPPARAAAAATFPVRRTSLIPFVNRTPLVAFAFPWQLKPPAEARVVVIKGTFDLSSSAPARLRAEVEPPSGDVHADDDPRRSLLYPTDFAVFKPKADVTLTGVAYAPGGHAPTAHVRFAFGHPGGRAAPGDKNRFDRRIAVFGERRGDAPPRPFDSMPLVYEAAFGGPAFAANPVGRGHEGAGGGLRPNLEDPEHVTTSDADVAPPTCFLGVAPMWHERWSKLGSYDEAWRAARWPYFPQDFDWAHFQAAPRAQQLEHLVGDEPFDIVGMRRDHAQISGSLPGLRPRCFAQRTTASGGAFVEVALRLDTATFDVEAMKLTLVWRGALDVEGDDAVDVAELFVLTEATSEAKKTLEQARAEHLIARAKVHAMGVDPDAIANDVAADDAHGASVHAQLDAAGLPFAPAAPAPTIDAAPPRDARRSVRTRAQVVARIAAGKPLAELDLSDVDLVGVDLAGQSLIGATLTRAGLAGANLAGANLDGAQLGGADLTNADLSSANLERADLAGAKLEGAKLGRARLGGASFADATAARADFRLTTGERCDFAGAKLAAARFEDAVLPGADFSGAELDDASFDRAGLTDARFYDAAGTRASFEKATLVNARGDGARFARSKLKEVNAASSNWEGASFDEADFVGAKLAGASFVRASCKRTSFSGADLLGARLARADISGAAFQKANLMEASLESVDATDADFRGANLHGAEVWKMRRDGARLEGARVSSTKLKERR